MSVDPFATLRHALLRGIPRRGLLAVLPLSLAVGEIEAKKKGKRQKKRRKNKKRRNTPAPPSPPPPPPGPSARVDAACSGETAGVSPVDGDARLAQTFTALASGPLVSAQVQIFKDPGSSGDYVLQLAPVDAFGFPTNEVLAATSVANGTVPDGFSTVSIPFPAPVSVVAGTRYALVLTRPGAINLAWEFIDDTCPGNVFVSPDQTAAFVPNVERDFFFTVFVSS